MYKKLKTTPSLTAPPTDQQNALYQDILRQTAPLKQQLDKRIKLIDALLKRYA
ncbi:MULTISPECIES: hypothetical protein [unclassified Spirosoma]|uniref:hypothetical protein n=1 Tax=unclassified Spirosoma TaxID=2621999 RepID=UPI000A967E57|nr:MULTISPECIES: hypothetical protein [unclassified Spirosoma]MBN8825097.1 hypothetical protein [Spirosoma sp.]